MFNLINPNFLSASDLLGQIAVTCCQGFNQTTLASRTVSLTVLLDILHARVIPHFDKQAYHFNRRTSLILHMEWVKHLVFAIGEAM